jgi:hypothetical protein
MRLLVLTAVMLFAACESVRAFCGFYVAQAGGELLNRASKVVLAHRGDRTVITMTSDIEGDPRQFALVVPVPTVVQRDQVRLVQSRTIDHLEAYTAPRLVEYNDPDPCAPRPTPSMVTLGAGALPTSPMPRRGADALGVHIEASYSVGEYDILVLSAEDSGGLLTWLNGNGYKVPPAAEPTVRSYLRQNMRFFVTKVNLERQERQGGRFLRPIQVEYSSPKFMLPIRLGTVNADGPQEMVVLALTERGRVETTNYRTVRIPTGTEVPQFIRNDFPAFYRAMFDRQVGDADGKAVFLEYAWDLNWCDPCAADPMSRDELRELGALWLTEAGPSAGGGQPAFVTRLHVRYDRDHFPEDLALQETGDRENFQARYVLQNPFTGEARCQAGERYRRSLPQRNERQARNLIELTNWTMADVRQRMEASGQPLPR